jgi:hypothetical protein
MQIAVYRQILQRSGLPSGREFKSQVGRECWERSSEGGGGSKAKTGATTTRPAHENQGSPRSDLLGRVPRNIEKEYEMLVEGSTCFCEVRSKETHVIRSARSHHDVIDGGRHVMEEPFE